MNSLLAEITSTVECFIVTLPFAILCMNCKLGIYYWLLLIKHLFRVIDKQNSFNFILGIIINIVML